MIIHPGYQELIIPAHKADQNIAKTLFGLEILFRYNFFIQYSKNSDFAITCPRYCLHYGNHNGYRTDKKKLD